MITDGVYSYTYDDEGQRTQRTRLSDGQTTDYVWDHRHRLTRVTVTTPGTGSGTVRTVDYAYDVFDRLVERSVSGTGLTTHREGRLFDGDAVLAEYNPDTGSLTNRYVSGEALDQVFAQYNTGNLSSPGESFALTDLLGSVRAIQPIDHTSDEFSAPFADAPVFAEYDAWGNTVWKDAQVRPEATLANGQTTDWTGRDSLFSWTGREYDPISGLQWNRARWYDPQVGRWLSDDPIGFSAGDTNLQRYVGNNPTNYVDPSGLKGECSVSERDQFSDLYGTDSELTREQEEAYNSASFGKTPSQIRAEASRAGRAVLGDHLSDEEAESLVYFARHGGFFNDPAFWAMSPAQRRGAIEAFRGRMEDRLRQLEYDRKQPTVGMATPADIRRGEELRLQREAEKARQSGSRMRQMHADMALAKHRGESTFVAGMSHLAGAAVDCACAASAIRRNAKPTSRSLARSPK